MASRLALLALLGCVQGITWPLETDVSADPVLVLSETYMYGTNAGPLGSSGDAYIHVQATVADWGNANKVLVAMYKSPDIEGDDAGSMSCEDPYTPAGSTHSDITAFFGSTIDKLYSVPDTGLYYVRIAACIDSVSSTVHLDGTVTFKNPYGYLPAMYYGHLPFEALLVLAYLIADAVYAIAMVRFRKQALHLHKAIALVLFLGTMDSFLWYSSYSHINATGEPFCCPIPGVVVAALVMEIVQKTVARVLLLGVCLGLGVCRQRVSPPVARKVGALALSYFLAALLHQLMNETAMADPEGASTVGTTVTLLLVLGCDITFLVWIFRSLSHMRHELRSEGQTFKLRMYTNLWRAIMVFVYVFLVLSLIAFLSDVGVFTWPWQMLWLRQIFWRLISCVVVVSVSWLWRPTATSALFATSSQIPSYDESDEQYDSDLELREDAGPVSGEVGTTGAWAT